MSHTIKINTKYTTSMRARSAPILESCISLIFCAITANILSLKNTIQPSSIRKSFPKNKNQKLEWIILVLTGLRPLKNVQFCSSSRKMKILTAGIHKVFRGLKFESDAEIGQKGAFCKGLGLAVTVCQQPF